MSQRATGPAGHYVDGEWIGDGETFESEDPATGESLGEFRRGAPADVERAVSAAEAAFPAWSDRSYIDRAVHLWEVFHQFRERHDELGEIVTRECGTESSEGRADVTEAWHRGSRRTSGLTRSSSKSTPAGRRPGRVDRADGTSRRSPVDAAGRTEPRWPSSEAGAFLCAGQT